MAFNAKTYYANKYRRSAWEGLAKARDIKERASKGEAYEWELPRIKLFVDVARTDMHLHLIYRRVP